MEYNVGRDKPLHKIGGPVQLHTPWFPRRPGDGDHLP